MFDRQCPVCGERKHPRFFRRWRGTKRILHADCNKCGERTLSAMSPVQRDLAVQEGRINVSPLVLKRLDERDANIRRAKIAGAQRAVHAGRRKRQWERALGTRLRQERDWARRNLANLPDSAVGWADFFSAYINVLTDMIARLVAKYNRVGTATMPTPKEAHPMAYVFNETLTTLRHLYSQCVPIPHRRLFRDPWCLEWREYEVPAELLEGEEQ